jgi:microcystin degradation protein MlrC
VVNPGFHRLQIMSGSHRVVVIKSGFHRFAIKPGSDRVVVVKSGFHRFALKVVITTDVDRFAVKLGLLYTQTC